MDCIRNYLVKTKKPPTLNKDTITITITIVWSKKIDHLIGSVILILLKLANEASSSISDLTNFEACTHSDFLALIYQLEINYGVFYYEDEKNS